MNYLKEINGAYEEQRRKDLFPDFLKEVEALKEEDPELLKSSLEFTLLNYKDFKENINRLNFETFHHAQIFHITKTIELSSMCKKLSRIYGVWGYFDEFNKLMEMLNNSGLYEGVNIQGVILELISKKKNNNILNDKSIFLNFDREIKRYFKNIV